MGREVRMVPEGWVHPRYTNEDAERPQLVGRFKPLYPGECYPSRLAEFMKDLNEQGMQYALDQNGNPPDENDYMPNWPEAERTHYMMYEDTSEGTPISPAFATPEELARWLADNGASSFGDDTATYEQWLYVCKGGWAPSMVVDAKGLRSGVEAMADG